jgi:hypothetical protein
MKSAVALAGLLVVAVLAAGCGESLSCCPAGASIVNDGPRLKLDWPTPPTARVASAAPHHLTPGDSPGANYIKEGPMIQVEARFISAEPAALKDAGLTTDSPVETLTRADLDARLARIQSAPSMAVLQAPRLLVLSGQPACVLVSSERPLVVDYDHKPAQKKEPAEQAAPAEKGGKGKKGAKREKEEKGTFVPVKMVLPEGTALELTVRAEGDEVVFTELKPRLVGLIASRQCSATAAVGKDEAKVKWQEPLALVGAGRLASPCSVRLKAGECLLVPLAYTIHETTADVRRMAKDKVQEEFTGGEGKRGAATPGKRPCVVVLSAQVLKAKAGTGNREPAWNKDYGHNGITAGTGTGDLGPGVE